MATFSDDFNRADGTLGSNWTTVSGFAAPAVTSNQAAAGSVALCLAAVATGTASFAANHSATATITALGDFDYGGPAVRLDAAGGTGYAIKVDGRSNANSTLIRLSGGGSTNIGGTYAVAANDVLKLEATGTSLLYYKNGTLIDTVVDTTYSTGQPGLLVQFGNVNAARLDTFSATDAASTFFRPYFITG
jgi:hypothetical protein